MMSLYKTLVRPHVEYCVSAWNPHCIKEKELIEKVHRRFTTRRPASADRTARRQFQAVMEKYTNTLSGYQFRAIMSLTLTDFWVYQVSLTIARPCIMKTL